MEKNYKFMYQLLLGKLSEELGEALANKLANEVTQTAKSVFPVITTEAFRWDWKDSPGWGGIQDAIEKILSTGATPHIYDVETNSDDYAVLVTSYPDLTADQAFELWDAKMNPNDEEE